MKRLLSTLVLILAFTLFIPQTHAAVLSGWGTATIDGVVNPLEWAGAATLPFTAASYTGTLYMMNDATNLYVGMVVINDPDLTGSDGFILRFDNDNGGEAWLEEGDDMVTVGGAFVFGDWFYRSSVSTHSLDNGYGGVSNGIALKSRVDSTNHYELSHPLNSGDLGHDFSLLTGQLVGFSVALAYNVGAGSASTVLFGDLPSNPSTWDHDYQVASSPSRPLIPPSSVAVGGIVIPSSKLSILEPYLALALIALTLFTLKKRL